MRRAIAVVLSLTLSGCAAHRTQVKPAADPLGDWASVVAIPRGTPTRVTLNYDIDGSFDDVTDATLTIRVAPNRHRLTFTRAGVVRVAVLSPKKMPWAWLGKPLAVGFLGGLVGALVGAVMRDAKVAGISLGVFAGSGIGFYYHLATHHADHEWRVVYMRLVPSVPVQALVVANPADERIERPRRLAGLSAVEIRSNQQTGTDEDAGVEHAQRNRGGPVRGRRGSGQPPRMDLARIAARHDQGIEGRRPAVPADGLEVLQR